MVISPTEWFTRMHKLQDKCIKWDILEFLKLSALIGHNNISQKGQWEFKQFKSKKLYLHSIEGDLQISTRKTGRKLNIIHAIVWNILGS